MSGQEFTGNTPCTLSGGPLDGAVYGDLPHRGDGIDAVMLFIPLSQPAATSTHALYVCQDPKGPDEMWHFTFHKLQYPELPAGTRARYF